MASLKPELQLLQKNPKRGQPSAEPMRSGIMKFRKVLVFSPDKERLSAVFEALSNCGHRCEFAKTFEAAGQAMGNPEIGYVVADGEALDSRLGEFLETIKSLRPDIYERCKYHIFSGRSASELREKYSISGAGIKPLEQ